MADGFVGSLQSPHPSSGPQNFEPQEYNGSVTEYRSWLLMFHSIPAIFLGFTLCFPLNPAARTARAPFSTPGRAPGMLVKPGRREGGSRQNRGPAHIWKCIYVDTDMYIYIYIYRTGL